MKITSKYVFFWNGIYSNWHPAKFTDTVDGIFDSVNTEQAFMYYKVKFFGDKKTAEKILKEVNPSACKKLGRQVEGYDDKVWSCVRQGYMVYVNYLKFSQNEDFKQEMLDTDDRILVEASPYDKIWGVGLREEDPKIEDEKNWLGLNLLGKALVQVRELIK